MAPMFIRFLISALFLSPHVAGVNPAWGATAVGTVISNTALVAYTDGPSSGSVVRNSNTTTHTVVALRTPAKIVFLKYAPQLPGATMFTVAPGVFRSGSDPSAPFSPISPPLPVGAGAPIDLTKPVPLAPADLYNGGEPIFIQVIDPDQNLDPAKSETVLVTISNDATGDLEVVRLTETGPDTGAFIGYINSTSNTVSRSYSGTLAIAVKSRINAAYTDIADSNDRAVCAAVVDPFGVFFNSSTGKPVDGVVVTLMDTATGKPAMIFGDDGISSFPATITSGGAASDSTGKKYTFSPGGFRYPFVAPGTYRFQVTPPSGYAGPSTVTDATLQKLPGAPFSLVIGSRLEPFSMNPGPAIQMDIPLDPSSTSLWLQKSAGKDSVAVGDFLSYQLLLQNPAAVVTATGISITDELPPGFRYKQYSTKRNGVDAPDPAISPDGRTLTFLLGELAPKSGATLRYVVEIGVGARLGIATNRASGRSSDGTTSNQATAAVQVRSDFMNIRSFILGEVLAGACHAPAGEKPAGVAGIRIFLEDGTYVVTDSNGMYHFEGIKPGSHVVQMDPVSMPEKYEILSCTENSRFAGVGHSQFVDLQGGTVWRADFHLGLKPAITGEAAMELRSVLKKPEGDSSSRHTVEYTLPIRMGNVPTRNLRLTVMLPDGVTYEVGTGSLNGVLLPEPTERENCLTYSLGELPVNGEGIVRFNVTVLRAGSPGTLTTRAFLTFDTPMKKNERSRVADNILGRNSVGATGQIPDLIMVNLKDKSGVAVPTVGLRTGEKWVDAEKETAVAAAKDMPEYGSAWLDGAAPGLAWLWPPKGYHPPIPSVNLAVKHDPRNLLKLFLNGAEVDPLSFEGTLKREVAAVSSWRGVSVADGDNLFEAVQYDDAGAETGRLKQVIHYSTLPVTAEFDSVSSKLIADGKNPPIIAVRLTDKDGHPARQGIIGEFTLNPPYVTLGGTESTPFGVPILTAGRLTYRIGENGIALIKLQPTMKSGEVVVRLNLLSGQKEVRGWLKPEYRDWILVGLGEGTVGYNAVAGKMESLHDAGQGERLYEEGRLAFYAKGRIKGEWLLTMAYDSAKGKGDVANPGLFQTIDPNSYYTLYGDGARQEYDASSSRKLYLKIERDEFYALFGDFNTGLTLTELSRYNRTLNGFKSEYQGKMLEFNLFGAETGQIFVKDELRGDGTSGLYRLSRGNMVLNSEKVTLETRDRFHSEIVVSRRMLNRFMDYSISPDVGTLFFKEPIRSRDDIFNPVYIVVEYEVLNSGGESLTYGGRGGLKLLDGALRTGFTLLHEGQGTDGGDLYGFDAAYALGPRTSLKVEAAHSDTQSGATTKGGNAYLAELHHDSPELQSKLYFREQDEGFGLGQQSGSEYGTRKVGGDAAYKLTKAVTLSGQAYRQYNLATGGIQDLLEEKISFISGPYGSFLGTRHAGDRLPDGTSKNSEQLTMGGSWLTMNKRLTLMANHDQSLGGNSAADFPTRTVLGADFKVTEKVALLARHEITRGAGADTNSTSAGIKAIPWEGGGVITTMGQNMNENGERVFALFGLKQSWKITGKWSVDGSLDRSQTVMKKDNYQFNANVPPASGENTSFTALSLGNNYNEKKWNWNSRLEVRTSDVEDKWGLFTAYVAEPKEGMGWSARCRIYDTRSSNGGSKATGDLRFGLVYRPRLASWTILERLDFLVERQKGGTVIPAGTIAASPDTDSRRVVNSLNVNYRPDDGFQLSLQYGAKYSLENIDGLNYSGYTDLIGLEGRHDLTKRWDVGLRWSLLHSWNARQFNFSAGASVGYNVAKNSWISVGYNVTGFTDKDFSEADYTARGPFVRFRFKL